MKNSYAYGQDAIELVDAFDINDLIPGYTYFAFSTTEAYGLLLGLIELGAVQSLGEAMYEQGVKAVAVVRGERSKNPLIGNPQIGIGSEYFITALKDYDDWKVKWWREAIQNSVDAGARRIVCKTQLLPDRTLLVSVWDDGGGMSEDVLIDKFLRLGGTTKVLGGGTAGGFGKAKELLVLPWLSWRIHSRGMNAMGRGTGYQLDSAPHISGTLLEVRMAADMQTSIADALAFITKCDLRSVRFQCVHEDIVDVMSDEERSDAHQDMMELMSSSDSIVEALRRGWVEVRNQQTWNPSPNLRVKENDLLDEVPGKANIYVIKSKITPYNMIIRVNGLFMFEQYIGDTPRKQVIVEITAPSTEVLTANRDGFRDRDLKRAVDNLGVKIAKDTMSALQKKKGIVKIKYEGTGKFRAERREAEAVALANIGPISMSESGVVDMESYNFMAVVESIQDYRDRGDEGLPDPQLSTTLLEAVTFRGAHHVEQAIRQLVWEPDFYLINEIEDWRVPAKFKPETMTPRVTKLVKVWTELCRFVLMQLGDFREFGVGLMFSENTAAAYLPDSPASWLLLNPYKDMDTRKVQWKTTDSDDVKWLYAAAVHECTHMSSGISYHDESFAAALTRNIAYTADGFRKVRGIVNSIKMSPSRRKNPITIDQGHQNARRIDRESSRIKKQLLS